jgi:hypothetical protein
LSVVSSLVSICSQVGLLVSQFDGRRFFQCLYVQAL